MEGGATAVHDAIERFGPVGAICYVHFRQVQGTVPSFQECFLGEGNYSPREVIDLLRRVDSRGTSLTTTYPMSSATLRGDIGPGTRHRVHAGAYKRAEDSGGAISGLRHDRRGGDRGLRMTCSASCPRCRQKGAPRPARTRLRALSD